jgi:hypothetical protein
MASSSDDHHNSLKIIGYQMGQRSEPPGFHQVYVLGLDHRGHPRGARFSVLKDSIVSAAMDMKYRILIRQPAEELAGQKATAGLRARYRENSEVNDPED